MGDQDERIVLSQGLQRQLSDHGFAFQYRAIKAAEDACSAGAPWIFESAEHPVSLRGKPTHIDLVLRNSERPIYLVGECKRVNPKFNTWYFLRAPYSRRDQFREGLYLDQLLKIRGYGTFYNGPAVCSFRDETFYDLGVVAKTENKGDASSRDTLEAINNAASQVCHGLAGLYEQWTQRGVGNEDAYSIYFLPTIFTTARLFGCKTDLRATDLATGNIVVNPDELEERPWVLLQYPRSPGVCPSATPMPLKEIGFGRDDVCDRPSIRLGDYRDVCFVRTVAIVGARHIADFLKRFSFQYREFSPPWVVEPPKLAEQ